MKRGMKNLIILVVSGLMVVGLISLVSAHQWGFDPSYRNYTLTYETSYDSYSGEYVIDATYVFCRVGVGTLDYSNRGVGWCSGTPSKCCQGGINKITKECNTKDCGLGYQASCTIFGLTPPITNCLRACEMFSVESTDYIQLTGSGNVTYVSNHPFCSSYTTKDAWVANRIFRTNNLNDYIISVGIDYYTGDGYSSVPIFIRPVSICGDGTCDTGEDCSSCPADCGCGAGEICQNGVCTPNKPCSSPNDIIMKLYSSTNSHGSLWNYPDYYYDICCSDIFGVGAGECNGVHTCSGTNKILGLYQANNSHAEIPSLDNYIYDVCYGNLICEAKIDPDPCSTYYEIIVRLYQNTNSHISNASNTNYPIKICCKAGVEITGAYWANMKEETITNVDLNDRVKLMVAGEGMENKEIDYTIYKSIPFWFDSKQAEDDVTGFTSWRASEAGTYYFIADVEGVNMQSGDLVVSATENNFPSVVNIVGPKTGDIFYIGEQMSFTQTSYDKDDEINLLWDLGDDTTSSEPSLTHPYSTIGQKTIKLTATDERGLAVTDRIAILIINPAGTKYVFAHIDEPEWGETLFGDLARVVEFNASSTYAVETSGCAGAGCTTDCCTIACLGGACHALTHEGGQGINANGMVGNYAPLNFSWTFDDGNWKNASGMDGVIFDWVFRTAGKHKAWLTASTNPFSSTEVEFSGFFDYPYCYRDKLTDNTFWYEPDGSVILSLNDCYRALALNPKPSTDCCPPSYACNTGLGICEQLEGIASCSQYSEEKCGSNVFVAEDELNPILEKNGYKCGGSSKYGTNCWGIVDCKCGFENQKCLAIAEHWICNETVCWDYTNLPGNIQTICDATTSPYSGQCSFSFDLLDECETSGFIKRTWDAAWIEQAPIPAYCADGSDQIPCKVTKLVFWKITGLIAAVLLIIIIYWFIIKKGKRK